MSAVKRTPEFTHLRTVSVADSVPSTNKREGMNFDGFRHGVVQVVPTGNANPVIKIMFWSEVAGKFVDRNTALTFTAVGQNVPWSAPFEVHGLRIWVMATGGLTFGQAEIHLAGAAERPR